MQSVSINIQKLEVNQPYVNKESKQRNSREITITTTTGKVKGEILEN